MTELLLRSETEAIIGCAIEVINTLGHGLLEKPYENALAVEFGLRGIPFAQQSLYEVLYKGVRIGRYVPDLIAFGTVVIEVKVIDRIADHELGQMLNYLRVSDLRVGLVFNFSRATLAWQRVVR